LRENQQKDGIVYGSYGRALMVDPQRVPIFVEELNASGHRIPDDADRNY
jgi:hypothetical protein